MPRTTTFSNTITGLSENITVRFDLFGGSNGSNGTSRMDDFVLNGYTTAVENWSPAGYRFGFNKMSNDTWISGTGSLSGVNPEWSFSGTSGEKTDELSVSCNHTTASFWENDTRLGRRWNKCN